MCVLVMNVGVKLNPRKIEVYVSAVLFYVKVYTVIVIVNYIKFTWHVNTDPERNTNYSGGNFLW